jgi:hypothetical protein
MLGCFSPSASVHLVFPVTFKYFAISGIVRIPEAGEGMAEVPVGWSVEKSRIGETFPKVNGALRVFRRWVNG